MPACAQRRRRAAPGADLERFEVWEIAAGRRHRGRVLATAATLDGARLAVKTLTEEGGADAVALAIRGAPSGRWIAR